MRVARKYTKDEIALICDPYKTASEIAEILDVHPITVHRARAKFGANISIGRKKGKACPSRIKWDNRICARPDCNVEFKVKPARTKQYCSVFCHTTHTKPWETREAPKKRNPNLAEYTRYKNKVHGLTKIIYEEHIDTINPCRRPRTLCGVDGGYQLDHIKPIKECFDKGIAAEEAVQLNNLRMLPWRDNLMRNFEC